jgi:TRAP-type C4-dicarboxylate transport system permease large subunit
MKTKNSSWKTTVASFIGLAIVLIMFALLYLGKITATELFAGLSSVGAFLTIVIGFLSKDKDVTGLPK